MLYTRKGDSGTSTLYGTSVRAPKDSALFDALGTLDELNALLGVARAKARATKAVTIESHLRAAQETLFTVQAEVAGAPKKLSPKAAERLEVTIDAIETAVGNPHHFIIPGATELSGLLDFARTVARRAERALTAAGRAHLVSAEVRAYVNRLSSLLYALARKAAAEAHTREDAPSYASADNS